MGLLELHGRPGVSPPVLDAMELVWLDPSKSLTQGYFETNSEPSRVLAGTTPRAGDIILIIAVAAQGTHMQPCPPDVLLP